MRLSFFPEVTPVQQPGDPLWARLGQLGAVLAVSGAGPAYMPLLWLGVLALVGRTRLLPTDLAVIAVALGALPVFSQSLGGTPGGLDRFGAELLALALAALALLWSAALTSEGDGRGLLIAALAALLLPPALGVPGLSLLGLLGLALQLGHARQHEPYRLEGPALWRSLLPAALLPLFALVGVALAPRAGPVTVPAPVGVDLEWNSPMEAFLGIVQNVVNTLRGLFRSNANPPPPTPEQLAQLDSLLASLLVTLGFLTAMLLVFLVRTLLAPGGHGYRPHQPLLAALGVMATATLGMVALYLLGAAALLEAILNMFATLIAGARDDSELGGMDPGAWQRAWEFFSVLLRVAQPLAWLALAALTVFLLRLVLPPPPRPVGLPHGEGLPRPGAAPPPRERVRLAYLAAAQDARRVGLGPRDAETPHEWTARLGLSLPGGAAAELARLYSGVRYGLTPDAASADAAEATSKALRRALEEHAAARPEA